MDCIGGTGMCPDETMPVSVLQLFSMLRSMSLDLHVSREHITKTYIPLVRG
jgi:hypothetical protein